MSSENIKSFTFCCFSRKGKSGGRRREFMFHISFALMANTLNNNSRSYDMSPLKKYIVTDNKRINI